MTKKKIIQKTIAIPVKAWIEIDKDYQFCCGRHCYHLRYLGEGRRTCTLFPENSFDEHGRRNGRMQPELEKDGDNFTRCNQCIEAAMNWLEETT